MLAHKKDLQAPRCHHVILCCSHLPVQVFQRQFCLEWRSIGKSVDVAVDLGVFQPLRRLHFAWTSTSPALGAQNGSHLQNAGCCGAAQALPSSPDWDAEEGRNQAPQEVAKIGAPVGLT